LVKYPGRYRDRMATDIPHAEHVKVMIEPAPMVAAYARHRRRFAASASELDAKALASPSRCGRWSVADVLRHGIDVDGWMHAIWGGRPLPFDAFDPVTTPDEFVAAGRAIPDLEVRDRFVESAESMAAEVAASDAERWALPSLSPLGAVPWWMSALHVFYDSWVHERDALVPLGATVPVADDEAVPVLAYNLAVVGVFISEPTDTVIAGVHLTTGGGQPSVTELGGNVRPDAGLIDVLSGRGELAAALPDVDAEIVHRRPQSPLQRRGARGWELACTPWSRSGRRHSTTPRR
jgi:uncharacterized protein (TIGR03083 family)